MLAAGYSDHSVAYRLDLSVQTIRWHVKAAYRRLEVHTRADALARIGKMRTHCPDCGRAYEETP